MSVYLEKAHTSIRQIPRSYYFKHWDFWTPANFRKLKLSSAKPGRLDPMTNMPPIYGAAFSSKRESTPEGIKLLTDLIASGYKDPNAQLLLGNGLSANGNSKRRPTMQSSVTQDYPDNPSAQLRAGLELEFLGNLQEAEKFLRKAIALSADDSEILTPAKFSLATISAKEGKNSDAVQLLGDIIRANPNDVHARVELGNIYHTTGKYQDAITILQQAVSFDPRNKRAHFLLGTTFAKLGKPKEAETQFKQFQELERSQTEAETKKPMIYTLGTE
ncbi:MAG: tetratricopeptide repeat protein [Terriglobia bacterium]